ncbi:MULTISPECIES: efflux RND transporter periplasmic adaptor subunit [Synechococcales]|uniref:efflux RND transporter periplasmic adaptor subunit n=1 Tax=Synechococcus sp. CS-1324 TaxID=2847980 RepID=UPI00223BD7C2|nr:efflux RND transporter periplasmic adaptor subunit [Synechococcus sp. CS-1324]
MSASPRFMPLGTGASLAAVLLVVTGCGGSPPPPPQRQVQVSTQPVALGRFSNDVDTISTLEAIEEVQLAAQTAGRIERLLVRQGDVVRQGQLLLVLDQAQVRADLASLIAQREKDRLNYERFEFLVRQGAASALQRDEFRAQYIQAREAVVARQADLAFSNLTAPISGVISDLQVKQGDVIAAGAPFTKVVRNDRLMARVDVPGIFTDRVRPGLQVVLQEPLGNRVLATGVVSSVDPAVNPGTQSLLLKAEFPNPTGALRTGLRLRTRVQLAAGEVPSVPFVAVTQSAGQSFVFAVGSLQDLERNPGKANLEALRQLPPGTSFALQVPVQLGALQSNRYPVLKGVDLNSRVITSNLLTLRHGTPVTVQ